MWTGSRPRRPNHLRPRALLDHRGLRPGLFDGRWPSGGGLRCEAPDVDHEERDEEDEEERGNRRAEAEEVLAAERTAPHLEGEGSSRRGGSVAGAIARMRSKSFSTPMTCVTSTTVSTGARSSTVTRRRTCHSVAAVRPRRLEHVARDGGEAGGDDDHGEAGLRPEVGEHDRGVIRRLAQPVTPVNGAANVTSRA